MMYIPKGVVHPKMKNAVIINRVVTNPYEFKECYSDKSVMFIIQCYCMTSEDLKYIKHKSYGLLGLVIQCMVREQHKHLLLPSTQVMIN